MSPDVPAVLSQATRSEMLENLQRDRLRVIEAVLAFRDCSPSRWPSQMARVLLAYLRLRHSNRQASRLLT